MKKQALHDSREQQRGCHAGRNSRSGRQHALLENEQHHIRAAGPQSKADSDFAAALRHAVGENTVESDPGQQHGHERERSEQ